MQVCPQGEGCKPALIAQAGGLHRPGLGSRSSRLPA